MKNKVRFKNQLYSYYEHLRNRLDSGAKYIDSNNCTEGKYYDAYTQIIEELSYIQSLINYYENENA